MKAPIIIIGIGEMGAVFARGFLRCGHPVYPVTRHTDITRLAQDIPDLAARHELDLTSLQNIADTCLT